MIKISVFIPTYNPSLKNLNATLLALRNQNLPYADWELIIVNNNSSNGFEKQIDVSWHPNYRYVEEPKPGLTYARLKGFEMATGPYIIMVDDDNILNENYLAVNLNLFEANATLGATGGIITPIFEHEPPAWLKEFYSILALRDYGQDEVWITWNKKIREEAPIGAGMGIRKSALKKYIQKIENNKAVITDRVGNQLCSGGDIDIVLEILKDEWQVMYSPNLILQHLIPAQRLKLSYISKLAHDSAVSWVNLMDEHQLNEMKPLNYRQYLTRVFKTWKEIKPWKNEVNKIKYHRLCGMYKGFYQI